MLEANFLGSTINRIKALNLQAVLLSLLYEDQLSRVQLARRTNLSSTTITNLVTELIENRIIIEDCGGGEDRQRSVGRPRTGLSLVPNARYAVGVHIGVGLFRVALVNLRAEILRSEIVNFSTETPVDEVLHSMSDWIYKVIYETDIDPHRVIGIGVGASGLVDYNQGINILAPSLGWHHVPIRDRLQAGLDFPITVDNNVRGMALAEAYFGSGRNVQSLVFVYGRIGVGAGFVVDGQLFRGTSAGAGEIGHMIMVPENGQLCRCGKRGCLETLVSERIILDQAEDAARRSPTNLLAQSIAQKSPLSPIDRVFQAARQGDPDAVQITEHVGNYLGIALANLVNTVNPELILLGGMFAQGADLILPTASAVMRYNAFANLGDKVRLETTGFGWRAGVTGAAALALLQFFYQQASISSSFSSVN